MEINIVSVLTKKGSELKTDGFKVFTSDLKEFDLISINEKEIKFKNTEKVFISQVESGYELANILKRAKEKGVKLIAGEFYGKEYGSVFEVIEKTVSVGKFVYKYI